MKERKNVRQKVKRTIEKLASIAYFKLLVLNVRDKGEKMRSLLIEFLRCSRFSIFNHLYPIPVDFLLFGISALLHQYLCLYLHPRFPMP